MMVKKGSARPVRLGSSNLKKKIQQQQKSNNNIKSCIQEKVNLLMCANSSINSAIPPHPISCVTCHLSHVTCHLSPVSCQLSPMPTATVSMHPLCTVDWVKRTKTKQQKMKKSQPQKMVLHQRSNIHYHQHPQNPPSSQLLGDPAAPGADPVCWCVGWVDTL